MQQKIELKPCPFCAEKANLCKDNYGNYMVICPCGAMIGIQLEDDCVLVDGWRATFRSIDKAIEAWNRRNGND